MKSILICTLFSFSLFAETIHLADYEKGVYSQNGEDGVIEKIFNVIGHGERYYVEFGTEAATECNTRYLKEKYNWWGLLMDGGHANSALNLHQEMITAENINQLFEKYYVPKEIDFLCIDVDFNDWYIWRAIETFYQPKVVMIEYNATHLPNEDRVIVYNAQGMWDGTNYFGGSILAFYNLGMSKGYSLVYANDNGVNLFFIRNDIIESCKAAGIEFASVNDVNAIYRAPRYGHGPRGGHIQDSFDRPYVESAALLETP